MDAAAVEIDGSAMEGVSSAAPCVPGPPGPPANMLTVISSG